MRAANEAIACPAIIAQTPCTRPLCTGCVRKSGPGVEVRAASCKLMWVSLRDCGLWRDSSVFSVKCTGMEIIQIDLLREKDSITHLQRFSSRVRDLVTMYFNKLSHLVYNIIINWFTKSLQFCNTDKLQLSTQIKYWSYYKTACI